MLVEVKKCVDNNDIKGLHYIFVDCLDVDPTFEKYVVDFEYCKNINGFLVPHMNITPIKDIKNWDNTYWEQLKIDLMKNFSEERFGHMKEVAKVIYVDKVDRLQQERGKTMSIDVGVKETVKPVETVNTPIKQEPVKHEQIKNVIVESTKPDKLPAVSASEKQQQKLLEKKRDLELYNQEIERKQQKQQARIEAAKKLNVANQNVSINSQAPKKSLGVAIATLVVVAIIVVVVLVKVL